MDNRQLGDKALPFRTKQTRRRHRPNLRPSATSTEPVFFRVSCFLPLNSTKKISIGVSVWRSATVSCLLWDVLIPGVVGGNQQLTAALLLLSLVETALYCYQRSRIIWGKMKRKARIKHFLWKRKHDECDIGRLINGPQPGTVTCRGSYYLGLCRGRFRLLSLFEDCQNRDGADDSSHYDRYPR